MSLLRSLTSLLAAMAVAIGGLTFSARPAQAIDDDDIFRLLLGAATVAILVRAWNDNRWDDRTRWDRRYPGNVLPAHCLETVRVRGRTIDAYNARCLYRAGAQALPLRCQREIRTNRGLRDMFSRQCLLRAGFVEVGRDWSPRDDRPFDPRPALLPASCQLSYRVDGVRVTGYYADCLERASFRGLPAQCALYARLDGVRHLIYNASCLRDFGYRTSRG